MEYHAQRPRGRFGLNLIRVIALLLVPWVASAQRYVFKYYAHEQGLGNLAVTCLLQDRTGYLWVGTENGLYRYDGATFSGFRTEEGLPAAHISSLHETADGTLWVGTVAGLGRRTGDRFQAVASGTSGEVWSITSDGRGILYLGTRDGLITGWWRAASQEWHFRTLPTPVGAATDDWRFRVQPGLSL